MEPTFPGKWDSQHAAYIAWSENLSAQLLLEVEHNGTRSWDFLVLDTTSDNVRREYQMEGDKDDVDELISDIDTLLGEGDSTWIEELWSLREAATEFFELDKDGGDE